MESNCLTIFQCDACDGSGVTLKLNNSAVRKNAIWKSPENGSVKNAFAAVKIAAIRKQHRYPAKDSDLALNTGIPKPAL